MNNQTEITIEMRKDVLKFLKAKAERYGYSVEEMIENYLKIVVRTKRLPFKSDELADLLQSEIPPIISAEDLAANFDDVLDTLFKTEDVMLIWRDGEIQAVIMMKAKYDSLVAAANATPKGAENES